MPQAMSYKGNSVIYFRGDASKKVYILQSGRVVLKREDIETGQEVQELIQTGEFFGVKSALGKYARDEDAIVVSDSQVITFTTTEFEDLVQQNPRIGVKMLKVFSTQLRKIHSKVRSMMALEEQRSPEDGLFHSAEYYIKKKKYEEAIHILRQYSKYYPQSRNKEKAVQYLELCEQYAQKYGSGNGPAIINERSGAAVESKEKKKSAPEESPEDKQFFAAIDAMNQGDFKSAIDVLKAIQDSASKPEVAGRAAFEIGRCLLGAKQYDAAIRHLGAVLKQYPELHEKADALFIVGQAYEKLGSKDKATSVYTTVLQLPDLEDDLRKKTKMALSGLGG